MKEAIISIMMGAVDEVVHAPDLNQLMKQFIQVKIEEGLKWSEITSSIYRMLGGRLELIHPISAAVEMVFLASDILDDLQDLDNTEKPWMRCPREYAMNAIISFMMCAYGEIAKACEQWTVLDSASLTGEASRLIAMSVNGQQRDLSEYVQTEEDYFLMVQEKSGSLMRFAFYMGYAMLEERSEQAIVQLNDIADCLAVMAQLDNDLRDILRYDVKNDLLHKKKTLPILFLLEHSDEDFPLLKQFYEGALTRSEFQKHKQECIRFITDSGCVEYVRVIQTLYRKRAEQLLDSIEGAATEWKEKFRKEQLGG